MQAKISSIIEKALRLDKLSFSKITTSVDPEHINEQRRHRMGEDIYKTYSLQTSHFQIHKEPYKLLTRRKTTQFLKMGDFNRQITKE